MPQSSVFPIYIRAETDAQTLSAFSKFEQQGKAASENLRRDFERNMGQVQSTIERALSIPRNIGGSLDLGLDELRTASQRADAFAASTRQLADAARQLQRDTNDTSKATQTYVQAASAAAREAEQEAAELRALATTHERLQAEINKTKAATDQVIQASGRGTTAYQANTQSVRAMRQATTQAGQQLQDIVISMGSGQRASTVLAQQLPQLAFAFSDVGGKVGAVARFLSGPWGVAVALGAFALGPFIDNLFTAGKESEKLKDKSLTLSEAFDVVNASTQAARKAIQDYNDAQKAATKSSALEKEELIAKAKAYAETTIRIRENIVARIAALQLADRELGKTGDRGTFGFGEGASDLSGALKAAQQDVKDAQTALNNLRIERAKIGAELATDPIAKINDQYDRMADAAIKAARGNDKLTASLQKTLTGIEKNRNAELEAEKDSKRRTSAAGPSLRASIGNQLLTSAQSYNGLSENTRSGRSSLQDLFNEANINIDPKITAWCAAFVNAVLATNGLPSNGQLNARSFLNYGSATDRPQKGDIVVLRRGDNEAQGHVGFYAGEGSKGKIRVTGGNQNNRVSTAEFSEKDVLAYRKIGSAQQAQNALERAQKEAQAYQNSIDQIILSVTRIGAEFDEQPRLIDRATIAGEKLRQTIEDIDVKLADKDLGEDQRKQLEEARVAALKAQAAAADSVNRPLRDIVKLSQEQAAIDQLLIEGRDTEAEILRRVLDLKNRGGKIDEEAIKTQADLVAGEQRRSLELEKQSEIRQEQLRLLDQTGENFRQTIRDVLDGKGFSNLIKRQFDIVKQGITDTIFRDLFGDLFDNQRLKILGLDKVDEAGKQMAGSIGEIIQDLDKLSSALSNAANKINGVPAANDNPIPATEGQTEAEIVVNGIKDANSVLAKTFGKSLEKLFGINGLAASSIGRAIEGAFQGAAYGQAIGSAFGRKGGQIGQAAGSILGSVNSFLGPNSPLNSIMSSLPQVGAALQLNQSFGKLFGTDQIKNGGLLTALIGGPLTALFGSALRGSATIGGVNGSLGITGTRGNSKSRIASASNSANSVIEQINSIAEQLGVSVNASAGSASIGIRKKSYVLDPTGQGRTKGAGVIKFGKGEEAAIEAARALALDLINDGVLVGLREGTKKLLTNAKSLEEGLEKALDFQSVFDRLKERDDPTGAAIDRLDREFSRLRNIFAEAGASAAEYAELERLYGLERADAIKEANERVTSSLKGLYDDLTAANDNRSLKERQAFALAQYDPLKARVAAGDKTAYDEFADVARTLLDIERQIFGSQSGYFSRLDEITGLTKSRIDAESNVALLAQNNAGIFGSTANDSGAVVGAITGQTNSLVAAINQSNLLLQQIAVQTGTSNIPVNFRLAGSTFF
jgi:uncharacterized protein (TIGR02594 family)